MIEAEPIANAARKAIHTRATFVSYARDDVGALGSAFPQCYSDRPIRLVVGFPPDGGTDLFSAPVGGVFSD